MDTTLRSTLDTLRAQREQAELEVDGLRVSLASAEQRLTYIRGAIENIEALVGESPDDETEVEAEDDDTDDGSESLRPGDIVGNDSGYERKFVIDDVRHRGRIPSTEWIAEIVNSAGRVMTRDEVFDEFKNRHGYPQSWTSPRNSLGNAINRAADRGWIERLDARHFAPQGYVGRTSLLDEGAQ